MRTKIRMKEVPLFVLYDVLHFMYGFRDFVSTNTSNDSDRSDRTLVSLDSYSLSNGEGGGGIKILIFL